MALVRWLGAADSVTDVWTLALTGSWVAGDTITLAIPNATVGPVITVTVGTTATVSQIATEIVTVWNTGTTGLGTGYSATGSGPRIPQFAEYVAATSAGTVVFTARGSGVPGTIAATRTTTGSGTVSMTNTTPATGPNFFTNVKNWSGGAVPVDLDTITLDHSEAPILYGLDQSSIEPAALHIPASYTGTIGLPDMNPSGYVEYRSPYLSIGPALLHVGAGDGDGSGRIKINLTTDQCDVTVFGTARPFDPAALILKGTNAANTLTVLGGSVGVGVYGGEAATLATVSQSGGDLHTGAAVTLTGDLTVSGGTWNINSLVDGTLTVTGGTVSVNGTGNVDQLTVGGTGAVIHNTTGALNGNTVLEANGTLTMGVGLSTVSVANPITLKGQGCRFIDPNKRVASVVFLMTGGASNAQLGLKPGTTVEIS